VDERIVKSVRDNTETPRATTTGPWPVIPKEFAPPTDSDHDGIPDRWEKKHGLDPHDPRDGAAFATNGYIGRFTDSISLRPGRMPRPGRRKYNGTFCVMISSVSRAVALVTTPTQPRSFQLMILFADADGGNVERANSIVAELFDETLQ
jgi:hypothetical protein